MEVNDTRNMNNNQNNDATVEIDLMEIFYLLKEHIVQILLALALGAVLAFGYTKILVTPLYSATAKMYILGANSNSNNVDMSNIQVASNLKADYQQLLTGRVLLEEVIKDLKLNMEYEELESCISISNPTDTRIINVTVTTDDAKKSADIANSLTENSKSYISEIMNMGENTTYEPSVYEPAIVPTEKSSPSTSKNTLIGGLLFALVYIAVIVTKHIMNDTLVTAEDINKYLGVQPLASIPEAATAKKKKSSKKKGGKK